MLDARLPMAATVVPTKVHGFVVRTILLPRYSLKGRSTYAATLDPMRPTMGMYEVPQWCIILYSGILWYVL